MSGMALDEVLIHLWMQRCLGGRELEDEPAVAHVDAGEAENVAEERAIRLRILRVEEYMCANLAKGRVVRGVTTPNVKNRTLVPRGERSNFRLNAFLVSNELWRELSRLPRL